jgi:hypothetical protein
MQSVGKLQPIAGDESFGPPGIEFAAIDMLRRALIHLPSGAIWR